MPDPQRLVQAYNQAASTLNLLRGFATGAQPFTGHIWSLHAHRADGAHFWHSLRYLVVDSGSVRESATQRSQLCQPLQSALLHISHLCGRCMLEASTIGNHHYWLAAMRTARYSC